MESSILIFKRIIWYIKRPDSYLSQAFSIKSNDTNLKLLKLHWFILVKEGVKFDGSSGCGVLTPKVAAYNGCTGNTIWDSPYWRQLPCCRGVCSIFVNVGWSACAALQTEHGSYYCQAQSKLQLSWTEFALYFSQPPGIVSNQLKIIE